jgi:Ni,Fe-hydrogenase I large subunit
MTKTIRIDPVTRIEGHLAINTEVEHGRVIDAKVAGRMYRGFEQLLVNRHPVDAARITQRVCGICHEVHGIAACMALEDLYQLTPSPNGLILRELILGLHLVTDHIFHFYQLTIPDYIDLTRLQHYRGKDARVAKLDRLFRHSSGTFSAAGFADALTDTALTVEMALGYAEATRIRKEAGSGLASLGGKVPFCHAILPGGVTTGITSDRLMNYAHALEQTTDFIERTYLPQALALAGHFPAYFSIGQAHGNFYCNGGFSLLQAPLYTGGVLRADGRQETARFQAIEEHFDATFLDREGKPQPEKTGAYSWVKALTYAGAPMEVGPLARLAVNRDPGFHKLLQRFDQRSVHSSVMTRILARAFEARKICRYLQELLPRYALDQPTLHPPDMLAKPSGEGRGMSLAARGPLNHQVTTEDGTVTGYRLQVPSTWNFGPTVKGQRGTVEGALVGTAVSGTSGSGAIEIGRIVRSFDPCLACAIH